MRLLVTLVPVLCPSGFVFAQDAGRAFLDAARRREAAVQSGEFVVRAKWHIEEGAFTDRTIPHPDGAAGGERRSYPNRDVRLEPTTRLVLDRVRRRLEDDTPLDGQIALASRLVVRNDQDWRELNRQLTPPAGFIRKPADRPFMGQQTLPILLACRFTEATGGQKIAPTGEKATIDGLVCDEYRSGKALTVWADPTRDHAIVRIDLTPFNKRYDVQLRRDSAAGWLPAGWTLTRRKPDGNLVWTETATVETSGVGETFPADRFDLRFPAGLRVSDDVQGKEFLAGVDGELLPAPPETAPPAPAPRRSWLQRAGVGAGVAFVGILAAVALRLKRGRQSGPIPPPEPA